MEQRQEMSEMLEMATFVHDRTPMCVAAGAAQMALDAGGKDVSAQLHQILQAVDTMNRMLTMMDDARETQGRYAFTGKTLGKELLAMTADKASAKKQSLSADLSALDGFVLEADYAALCRVLLNLLDNAVKYTQVGGMIILRAQVSCGYRRDARRVKFVVADNGMGMTREFMRRMYHPFMRAKGMTGIPGSGLGLSIVRDMVARMGGTIRVRSEKGRGTMFSVSVPVHVKVMN